MVWIKCSRFVVISYCKQQSVRGNTIETAHARVTSLGWCFRVRLAVAACDWSSAQRALHIPEWLCRQGPAPSAPAPQQQQQVTSWPRGEELSDAAEHTLRFSPSFQFIVKLLADIQPDVRRICGRAPAERSARGDWGPRGRHTGSYTDALLDEKKCVDVFNPQ